MRKLTITWAELSKILLRAGVLMPAGEKSSEESIAELTLTKPRQLLIRTEQAEQISK